MKPSLLKGISSLFASALLFATPVGAAENAWPGISAPVVSKEFIAGKEQVVQKLTHLLPYMKDFTLERMEPVEKDGSLTVVCRKEDARALDKFTYALKKANGELVSFSLQKELPDNAPELPLKQQREKAGAFLNSLYGNQAKDYVFDEKMTAKVPGAIIFAKKATATSVGGGLILVDVDFSGGIVRFDSNFTWVDPASAKMPVKK